MSKVEFVYGRGGKKVLMARRYAETLRKLGHGTYADDGYQTRMLTAGAPVEVVAEPLASAAILEFAKENGVDIEKVVGTGKDGRIKKSDVEAFIDTQDLA
ncbi:dihydrolipoamide acetyltransferase [compost metagenome]